MAEISKTFNEKYNFWVVKCENGHKITSWTEDQDIKEYNSFSIAYCPKDADLDDYYCVTDEQDAEYVAKREAAVEAEMGAENKSEE